MLIIRQLFEDGLPTSNEKVFKKIKVVLCGDALSIVDVVVFSEDGSLSIPKTIAEKLNISPGTRFAIVARGDTILLKRIQIQKQKKT